MSHTPSDTPEIEAAEPPDAVAQTHDETGGHDDADEADEADDGEELEEGATFLAVFLGSKNSPRMQEWMALPDDERKAREGEGIAAWKDWMAEHEDLIVDVGGPLGKTKAVSLNGVDDISNNLSGFVVLYADSHEEAAELFQDHPHFTIFPGDSVEVMPIMPIPAG